MSRGFVRYVAKRLGFAALMLAGVSVILFTLMRLAPGGPEAVLIGGEFSQEVAAQVRERLGLDRPLLTQYGSWILRRPAWRPRALLQDRRPGSHPDPRPARADAPADGRRPRLGAPGGRADGRPRRRPAGHGLGHAGLDDLALRCLVPELLARDHADPPLLGGTPSPAALGTQRVRPRGGAGEPGSATRSCPR